MKTRYYAAAGGLVTRNGQLLVLHKHLKDEYVLPKGHVEAGETADTAALREVREETGFGNLEVLANLGTLRGEFTLNGEHVQRDETYFLMHLIDEQPRAVGHYDDAEKDLATFKLMWVPLDKAAERLSFEPARTFARRAAAWMAERA